MIEAAIVLGVATCASFLIFLFKCPKKIRTWLLKRQLTLDVAFTAFCLAITLPAGLGPTSLMGIAMAGIAWSLGLWVMKNSQNAGIDIRGYLGMPHGP